MASLNLQQDEKVLTKAQAQLLRGFPSTTGDLYLTNKRLILIPNQLLSVGFGKKWELPLSQIKSAETKGRFAGGPFRGSAGNRLVLRLHDNSECILAFLGDIKQLFSLLSGQIESQPPWPQEAAEVDNGEQPGLASVERTPQPSGAMPSPMSGTRLFKDRSTALILEILPGLFGFLGLGWMYSGNMVVGVSLLVGGIIWWCISITAAAFTSSLSCFFTVPVSLAVVAISSFVLSDYTKRHTELFGVHS